MWRWIFVCFIPFTLSAQLKRFEFSQHKMGSPFRLVFYCKDSAAAQHLALTSYALVDSLNTIFSDYLPSSEVNELSRFPPGVPVSVSPELFSLMRVSKQAWKKSGKAFDITLGALTQLWRKRGNENPFPTSEEIKQAKQASGFDNVVFDEENETILYTKKGIRLDLGGIAKGYTAQRVIDYLKSRGIGSALADAGGDLVMSDAPPDKTGWSIAINLPESETEYWDKNLVLKNCAVATSGDIYRYTIHNGKKYSHIIDPRTGYGVTSQRNVTVIAKDGTPADWLATACSILPVKKAKRLVKKENASLFIALIKNEKIVTNKTKKFDRYFKKKEP